MKEDLLPNPVSPVDYYQIIRHRLEHEDGLIVQRLSWLVASQSFLFSAYAITLNGMVVTGVRYPEQQERFLRLVPAVGLLTCVLIYVTILAAVRSMAGLRAEFLKQHPDGVAGLPPLQSARKIRDLGFAAPLVLPLVFVAAWLYLLATRL